ncbi:hypothetical protein E05_21900 [Plautia stali symbiont]|nr:hypothetical protein E05_21900 [Plautia stali symbiont]
MAQPITTAAPTRSSVTRPCPSRRLNASHSAAPEATSVISTETAIQPQFQLMPGSNISAAMPV